MKKIKVNTEGCIGCGMCYNSDPEHFGPNEEGYSTVISEENIDVELVQNLVASCPVGVISLVDEDEKECNCDHCHCHDDEAA